MKKYKLLICVCCLSVILVVCILGAAWITLRGISWGYAREVSDSEKVLRQQIIAAAESWLGSNETDNSHREIIDIYNRHEPLAQNYKVKYSDEWCATFGSTVAIQCGLTDIIPTECGCQRQIALFKQQNAWQEDDAYIPLPGDYIFYALKNRDTGDCTAWSDHVGIVIGTWNHYIKVIEGNFNSAVAYRIIPVDDQSIRGFATPDYNHLTQ